MTAARFHYHFRRQPAPFELDPGMPLNLWYLQYREGSLFQVDDWEGFRDPHKLTYKDYVALQHDRETYVGQMAPSAFITNAAHFSAADEMRRVQRIAYWTKVLANTHSGELATTELARGAWENDPAWQPLRRACEQLLVARDWGEAFAARNLALKPALDALLNSLFADLARRNSDEFLALLFTEFQVDSQRSQDWSSALVSYALEHRPELREVLTGWLGTWQPRAVEAVEPLAAAFATAPVPIAADQVMGAVREQHRAFLQTCGL